MPEDGSHITCTDALCAVTEGNESEFAKNKG